VYMCGNHLNGFSATIIGPGAATNSGLLSAVVRLVRGLRTGAGVDRVLSKLQLDVAQDLGLREEE
jgi:hypothetical protein